MFLQTAVRYRRDEHARQQFGQRPVPFVDGADRDTHDLCGGDRPARLAACVARNRTGRALQPTPARKIQPRAPIAAARWWRSPGSTGRPIWREIPAALVGRKPGR